MISFVCHGDILTKVSRSHQVSNLRNLSCSKMPENWPAKSDYNSKWVIGVLTEAKVVWGFDLKMLRKLCSLGQFQSYKKGLFMGRMYTPSMYTQRVKDIITHLRKAVYINVYLHVNLTLLKIKTKKKYN